MEDTATSSITSIWTSINSWFTSTVFFILLNLMIATILFTSNLPTTNNNNNNNNQNKQEREQEQQNQNNRNPQDRPRFTRSPSSILHRLKSFNFYPERPEQELFPENHHHLQEIEVAATQYVFNQPIHYQQQHFDIDPSHEARQSDFVMVETDTNHFVSDPTHEPIHYEQHFDIDPTHDVRHSDFKTRMIETDTNQFDGSYPTHEPIHRDSDTEVSYQEDENEEEVEEETDEFESLDEVYSRLKGGGTHHHDRTQSDGAISSNSPKPAKAKKTMRKSASLKVGFARLEKKEEEIVEARRPDTMREKSAVRMMEDEDDVEVDSKAADFINKFKNDLILQRIESIAARSK